MSHMDLPERKRPARMPVMDSGNRSVIIFLTVCVAQRKPILAHDDVHQLLREAWIAADHWVVGRYVIMPEHVHLFCAPARHDHLSVKRWVDYWKTIASLHWPRREEQPVWQVDGWDTQLRQGESYSEKWRYVRQNPVRAGLVEHEDDWPYQGELSVLRWHDA